MFAVRIAAVLFLSLLTINQVSAKLGALGVLEVLRQDFETMCQIGDNRYQQPIATTAIQMIVMTRLSANFQRHNYRIDGQDRFKTAPEFPNLNEDFDYNKYHFGTSDLHGTPSSELSKAPYQSFGFASHRATLSQKTRYIEWFLKAILLKINVDDILEKAAFLPEITNSARGRKHLKVCRKLWALTTRVASETGESKVSPYYKTPIIISD